MVKMLFEFDAASIKPAVPRVRDGGQTFTASNVALRNLISGLKRNESLSEPLFPPSRAGTRTDVARALVLAVSRLISTPVRSV